MNGDSHDGWGCWDGLVFSLAASLTLWADLPSVLVAVVLAGALLALRGAE
jgi:hypothetical protein